ncbi:hypothetical protein QYF61_001953 [Mycteria americana]|uniref:GAIN-B domain-containing protein n=1 Tax=Mycteria americana TaxID=33587 RepID=A0AAN7MUN9_MYCAM|nr:hypothetical protein QYF61_001953 [Mycteria americana]
MSLGGAQGGAEHCGMARSGQDTPQSSMILLLGTVLLLLVLPGGGLTLDFGVLLPFPHTLFFQTLLGDRRAVLVSGPSHPCPRPGACPVPQHPPVTLLPSSPALRQGDRHHRCCNTVESEEQGDRTPSPDLPWHCLELGCSGSPACACLRERWLRLLQSVGPALHSGLAGLKVLLLNVSRAATCDVLIIFSPTEGPRMLNKMEKGKVGKIQLPREIFQSLSSQTAHVVVTVLNIQQLGMFKEANQTGQVLDNTVVGITVGEMSISRLRDPVQLTFAHGQLPYVRCHPTMCFLESQQRYGPFLESPAKGPGAGLGMGAVPSTHGHHAVPVAGQAGGWRSSGCVKQLRDKGTVCSCDHLTFFTLLLVTITVPAAPARTLANPALDGSTAQALMAVATAWLRVSHGFLHLHNLLLHLLTAGCASSSLETRQAGRDVEQFHASA